MNNGFPVCPQQLDWGTPPRPAVRSIAVTVRWLCWGPWARACRLSLSLTSGHFAHPCPPLPEPSARAADGSPQAANSLTGRSGAGPEKAGRMPRPTRTGIFHPCRVPAAGGLHVAEGEPGVAWVLDREAMRLSLKTATALSEPGRTLVTRVEIRGRGRPSHVCWDPGGGRPHRHGHTPARHGKGGPGGRKPKPTAAGRALRPACGAVNPPEPCPQRTSAQSQSPVALFEEEATWAQRSLMAGMGQGSKVPPSETGGHRVLSKALPHCPDAA